MGYARRRPRRWAYAQRYAHEQSPGVGTIRQTRAKTKHQRTIDTAPARDVHGRRRTHVWAQTGSRRKDDEKLQRFGCCRWHAGRRIELLVHLTCGCHTATLASAKHGVDFWMYSIRVDHRQGKIGFLKASIDTDSPISNKLISRMRL